MSFEHHQPFWSMSFFLSGYSDVLVSPIRCVPRMSELSVEEVADLFALVSKVIPVVEKAYNGTSSTVVVQDGKDAGQTIQVVV